MIYFLYASLIYIVVWYIYMWIIYLLGCFFSFLVTINGVGLPQPHELAFYPGDLSFAPLPDRAVPRHLDPSIV
jgi:hypothetical protein